MREYRVIDAWKHRGKNAGNGSISSGGTVATNRHLSLLYYLKEVRCAYIFLCRPGYIYIACQKMLPMHVTLKGGVSCWENKV